MLAPVFRDRADKSTFNDLALSEGLQAVRLCFSGKTNEQASEIISEATTAKHSLAAFNFKDFLAYDFPKRDYIMDPILTTQGLAMLYAPRGLGKTFLALSIAYAVAAGLPLLRFMTPKPRRVLFVDGEMQGWMMQERLSGIELGFGPKLHDQDFFRIISPDLTPDSMPNLATPEGQGMLEPSLAGVEFLILDNLATLCRKGKENEAESWLPVQEWLLSLRRRGISALVVHHSGKNGCQRGTSSREDVMDTVIALRPLKNHQAQDGARFEVHLEKARGLASGAFESFEASLIAGGKALRWKDQDLGGDDMKTIARLRAEGVSIRDIAEQTGIPKTTVDRRVKQIQHIGTFHAPSDQGVPASQS